MAWQVVLDIQAVIFWPLRMNEVDEGDRDALNIRFFFFYLWQVIFRGTYPVGTVTALHFSLIRKTSLQFFVFMYKNVSGIFL